MGVPLAVALWGLLAGYLALPGFVRLLCYGSCCADFEASCSLAHLGLCGGVLLLEKHLQVQQGVKESGMSIPEHNTCKSSRA